MMWKQTTLARLTTICALNKLAWRVVLLRTFVSGLATSLQVKRAHIGVLGFILTLTTLVFWSVAAVVSRRLTLLTFALTLFILAFAVPAGSLLLLRDESPAAGSDRLRELCSSPREAISLNDSTTTAKQVIVRPIRVVLGEPDSGPDPVPWPRIREFAE